MKKKSTLLLTGTLLLGLILSGCGRSGMGPEGEISGKVTYNGKPLPGGQVTFFTPKGHTFSSNIDTEGNYKVKALVGEAHIAVDNRMLDRKGGTPAKGGLRPPPGIKVNVDLSKMEGSPPPEGTYVPLPKRYAAPETSGLTYNVTNGPQTYNIELSP